MPNLAGKSAVVTGASRGIGRAIALELAAAGADVWVHARRSEAEANEVAARIRDLGRRAEVVLADLADDANRKSLVERTWTEWGGGGGGIDIWVNNAGADTLTGGAANRSFEQKLETLWRVDVTATIQLSRDVGRRMKLRGKGTILNMGWDQAEHGMAGDSGELFAAIKGAIMAFTKSLALSLAPEVRVNCLAPGWIKTAWGEQASAAWQEWAKRESQLGRWGTPEDVAKVAAFLASEDAAFIQGQIVNVNGGFRPVGGGGEEGRRGGGEEAR